MAVASVMSVCCDQLRGPRSKRGKWEVGEGYRKSKFTQWLEKQLHGVRCGYLTGPSVFEASRDPTNVSKYPGDEKIIDNEGNFSLVQMGLMNGV